MPLDDPGTWYTVANSIKTAFDALRGAMGMIKEARDLGGKGSETQEKAIDAALEKADLAARTAEAEIAKAFGYEFCRCEFPPMIMKTVGYINNKHAKMDGKDGQVYECPKCGFDTAAPWNYQRIAPDLPNGKSRVKLAGPV
jgi:hypothetical protein